MFEWYGGLPSWLRFSAALFFLLIATLMWLLADRVWIWCWAVGIALLLFAFPTQGEKKGFHDF
jgi:hypothetical protein